LLQVFDPNPDDKGQRAAAWYVIHILYPFANFRH
jgi:hypothetical protein